MRKALIPTVAFAACAVAQQPANTTPPRLPDPATYNLAAGIANGEATVPGNRPKKKRAEDAPPEMIQVEREKPLSAQARTSLNLARSWSEGGPLPAVKGGRVIFAYGQSLPTVVCAIRKACEIDLEPGEKLSPDAIDWGDTRFTVASHAAGSGTSQFSYLVVKPTAVGLDTTLMIGTDRRSYYLHLISTESEYIPRVAFSYPEEEAARKTAEETARLEAAERAKETEKLARLNTDGPMRNWNYTVELHGKDAAFLKPESIGDDGVHTHIKLSEEARHRGLPVIRIEDAQGPIPANTHWEGNELIVDALFEHACLLEGVGKKQQRACITNHGLKGKAN